jgi:hypothetical protein
VTKVGSDGAQILELPDGERWPAIRHPKLFVRDAYHRFYDKYIQGHRGEMEKNLIVCGTPGIGKSSAGAYFIHRALQEKKTVVYRTANNLKCFVYEGSERRKLLFTSDRVDRLLENPNVLFIADGVAPPIEENATGCAIVLITSPKREVWFTFSKLPDCKHRYFPIPTLNEMKLFREYCFPDIGENEFMRSIHLFGLNFRALYKCAVENNEVFSETGLRRLVDRVDISLLTNAVNMSSTGKDGPSHRLIFIRVTDAFLEDGREFASEFVAKLVCERLKKVGTEMFHAWLRPASDVPVLSGLFCRVFEHVSVDIIAKGGTFKTMDMVTGEYKEETFPVREVKFCSSLPEVLTTGVLFRAPHEKYPAIDAIAGDNKSLLTFNATVDPKHTVLMLNATQKHCLMPLQERFQPGTTSTCQHYLLFPEDKFPDVPVLTAKKFVWSKPHSAMFNSSDAKKFTPQEIADKQNLWKFSAVSVPLPTSTGNGTLRKFSTLRTLIRRCLHCA